MRQVRLKTASIPLSSLTGVILLAVFLLAGIQPVRATEFSQDGNIVLAALTTSVPSDRISATHGLFGATEQRYADLSAFTKWTGVLAKFKRDFPGQMNRPEVQDWMSFLSGLKTLPKKKKSQRSIGI